MRSEQPGHVRIQIDQGHRFDRGMAQNLAHRQPVATAEHQHPARPGQRAQPRMHQRFVIAVFIAGAELQVAVEKQPQIILPAGDDDALIGRAQGQNDFIAVEIFLGQGREPVGGDKTGQQRQQRGHAQTAQTRRRTQLFAEQPQGPGRHQHVQQTKQQAGTHQTQMRHQQHREQQRHRQRAEIIQGQHLRHQILEGELLLENAHHQRNFQPDQNAHRQYQPIQRQAERPRPGKNQKQQRRGKATE